MELISIPDTLCSLPGDDERSLLCETAQNLHNLSPDRAALVDNSDGSADEVSEAVDGAAGALRYCPPGSFRSGDDCHARRPSDAPPGQGSGAARDHRQPWTVDSNNRKVAANGRIAGSLERAIVEHPGYQRDLERPPQPC